MHIFLTTHDVENLFVCLLAILKQRIGFPDSSVGKESSCNEGDPGSILESGRSARERIAAPPPTPVFLELPLGVILYTENRELSIQVLYSF